MRSLKVLLIVPAWLVLSAAASPSPSPIPSHALNPSPSPSPVPTPLGANITLDNAAGGPNTNITATGSSFLPNESMSLYWDTAAHVAAGVTTDGGGSFTKAVKPFPGDAPGVHRLCASVQPNPCASFTLQGSPTPTPPDSPIPSTSASGSPSPSPLATASASRLALTTDSGRGGLDVITKPPFVFLPIIGLLALLAATAYWLLMRVDRTPVLPSASVVHRSARPDIEPPPPQVLPTSQEPSPKPPVAPQAPTEQAEPPGPPPY